MSQLLSSLRARAVAGVRAYFRLMVTDPFAVLHRYQWSAPWHEAECETLCREGCG